MQIKSTSISRRQLSHVERYKLCRYIEQHAENQKHLTDTQVASTAALELGFAVTSNNVSAARKTTGVTVTVRRRSVSPNESKDRVRLLARELRALMTDLDIPPSKTLEDLCIGRAVQAPRLTPVEDIQFNLKAN